MEEMAVATWVQPKDLLSRHVTVIGSGTLGSRVALVWASQGGTVKICDTNSETLDKAINYVNENLPAYVKHINGQVGVVLAAQDLTQAVKGAWMVVECIPELLQQKTDLLGQLDTLASSDTIIATNSSSYKSSELIGKVKQVDRVLNTHYYIPPQMTPVELMTDGYTAPGIMDLLLKQLPLVGMNPIMVKKESTGFIYNRIWAAIKREIMMILADGISEPAEIDLIFRAFFRSKGAPCELMDSVGLQTVYDIEQHYIHERGNIPSYPAEYLRKHYVDKGSLGVKTGKGLYDYGAVAKTADE